MLPDDHDSLVLVERHGLGGIQAKTIPVAFGQGERFIVLMRAEESLQILEIERLDIGGILERLRDNVPGCPVAFQLDDNRVSFPINAEQVNVSSEVSDHLPPYNEQSPFFQDSAWIGFQPLLKRAFFVFGDPHHFATSPEWTSRKLRRTTGCFIWRPPVSVVR